MGKDFFRHFYFSKRERNGIFVLIGLILILLLFDYYLRKRSENSNFDFKSFEEEIAAFEKAMEEAEATEKINNSKVSYRKDKYELFEFDPNNTTNEEWKKLGLTGYQIQVIRNYLGNGGYFYKKEDLKKIYGLDEKTYNRLKSYINIQYNKERGTEKKKYTEIKSKTAVTTRKIQKINLNKADSIQLILVDGIGEVFSKRICKYRDLLGGYLDVNQLNEVYGINDSIYNEIVSYFKIDSSKVQKINLNKADFTSLIRHPYLNKYQTNSILKYRELKGKIEHTRELVEYNILPEKTYFKIKGYITCE